MCTTPVVNAVWAELVKPVIQSRAMAENVSSISAGALSRFGLCL